MRLLSILLGLLAATAVHARNLCPESAHAGRAEMTLGMTPQGERELPLSLALRWLGAGTYLVAGTLRENGQAFGAIGSARCDGSVLLLDLTISAGFGQVPPDGEMRALYRGAAVPPLVDAAGYSVLRAQVDMRRGGGPYQAIKQVALTGGKRIGPVLQTGRMAVVHP